MSTSNESVSGDYYSPSEELEIFISWGNQLTHTDPEFAEALIEGMVAGAAFEQQRPLPTNPEL